jgi:hypothetical protein
MVTKNLLQCDGCGQLASPEHIAKRLERLEWTTRYRPVHIGTLLLGAAAPSEDAEFLYSPDGAFAGEAGAVLAVAGVSASGKAADAVLAEFQRTGFLLTYVMECPLDNENVLQAELSSRIPALVARVRRSMRPKRLVPISGDLQPLTRELQVLDLGCPIVLDGDKPFAIGDAAAAEHLRQALTAASASAR